MTVSFMTTIDRLDHLINTHYLLISQQIVQEVGGLNTRLLCTVNEVLSWQCGLTPLKDGQAYVTITSQRMQKLQVKLGDQVSVMLTEDTTEYGLDMPEELQVALDQDPISHERYKKLVGGKQRFIIRYVLEVKNSQLRVDRALLILRNLKSMAPGKESFRGLVVK
ncbi:MAG: YdeI/OmpD-associated family protein [Siphonobacter sp.]